MFSMIFIEMSKKYPVYSLNNLGVGDIAEIFAQSRMLTKASIELVVFTFSNIQFPHKTLSLLL